MDFPSAGQLDVWFARLYPQDEPDAELLKRPEDRWRASQIIVPLRRRQFVFRRLVQDQILGRYGDGRLADLALATSRNGKPYWPDLGLFFNLSASGDWCVLALGASELGVDLERRAGKVDVLGLCQRFIPDYQGTEIERGLVDWCRLEAYVKYKGYTLAQILSEGDVQMRHWLQNQNRHEQIVLQTEFCCAFVAEQPFILRQNYFNE